MERPEPLRTLEVWAIALRPPKAVRGNRIRQAVFSGKSDAMPGIPVVISRSPPARAAVCSGRNDRSTRISASMEKRTRYPPSFRSVFTAS